MEAFMTIGMLGAVVVAFAIWNARSKYFFYYDFVGQSLVLAQGIMDGSAYVIVICAMILSINTVRMIQEYLKEKRCVKST